MTARIPRRRRLNITPPSFRERRWLVGNGPPPAYYFLGAQRLRMRQLWEAYGPDVIRHFARRHHGALPRGYLTWEKFAGREVAAWKRHALQSNGNGSTIPETIRNV